MRFTEELQVRGSLADAVGRSELPGPVWDVLVGAGHVRDFLERRITSEVLTGYARALLFYGDVVEQVASPPEPRQGATDSKHPTFDYEAERATALVRYLELKVSAHPDVLRFRRRRWSGGPLGDEEALLLAESPDLRETPPNVSGTSGAKSASGQIELYARGSRGCVSVEFSEGSVLAQLKEVSQRVREDLFPPWSEAEAAWVVVTGKVREAPQPLIGELSNLSNEHLTRGSIRLEVEPWVSAESLTKAYQWLQARTLGRKPRALIRRNLRVVQFVFSALKGRMVCDPENAVAPPPVSWRKLMDSWNESNPDEAYEDERHFHRDFHRTADAVVRPYGLADSWDGYARWVTVSSTPWEQR